MSRKFVEAVFDDEDDDLLLRATSSSASRSSTSSSSAAASSRSSHTPSVTTSTTPAMDPFLSRQLEKLQAEAQRRAELKRKIEEEKQKQSRIAAEVGLKRKLREEKEKRDQEAMKAMLQGESSAADMDTSMQDIDDGEEEVDGQAGDEMRQTSDASAAACPISRESSTSAFFFLHSVSIPPLPPLPPDLDAASRGELDFFYHFLVENAWGECEPVASNTSGDGVQLQRSSQTRRLQHVVEKYANLTQWLDGALEKEYVKMQPKCRAVLAITLWHLLVYHSDEAMIVKRVHEKLSWCLKQESDSGMDVSAVARPAGIADFYIRIPHRLNQRHSDRRTTTSSGSNRADPAWVVTFDMLIDVCRSYGAPVHSPTQQGASTATGSCPHNMDSSSLSSTIFTETPNVRPSTAEPRFSHNFRLALQCFLDSLNLFPHTRIFSSLCQRHDCIIMFLRILRHVLSQHPSGDSYQVITPILIEIFDGIEDEYEQRASSPNQPPAAVASVSDEVFTTLSSLFLSPLLAAPNSQMAMLLKYLQQASRRESLFGQCIRSAAYALLQTTLTNQSLSSSLLHRNPSLVTMVKLLTDPDTRRRLEETNPKLQKQTIRLRRMFVRCSSLVFDRQPRTKDELDAFLVYTELLDSIRHKSHGIDTQLVDEIVLHHDLINSIRLIHAACQQRDDHQAVVPNNEDEDEAVYEDEQEKSEQKQVEESEDINMNMK